METIDYNPEGTCSRRIQIILKDDIVQTVDFEKGCPGNLAGIKALVEGMHRDEVIRKLKGIGCYGKGTSCPDQLAQALSPDPSEAPEEGESEDKDRNSDQASDALSWIKASKSRRAERLR